MQKEKQPYEFKRRYAQIRADEFRRECDKRGLNCHVSVGGLDSIILYIFLKKICNIDVQEYLHPIWKIRVFKGTSGNRNHKCATAETRREDRTCWMKPKSVIQEFGFR